MRGFKVAEAVAQNHNRVKGVRRVRQLSCIPLPEPDAQGLLSGLRLGPLDKVVRPVHALHIGESPSGKLKRVPSLTAAKVKDPVVLGDAEDLSKKLNLLAGDLGIVHNVRVGLEVDGVKQASPPVGRYVLLKVGNRSQRALLPPRLLWFSGLFIIGRFALHLLLLTQKGRLFLRRVLAFPFGEQTLHNLLYSPKSADVKVLPKKYPALILSLVCFPSVVNPMHGVSYGVLRGVTGCSGLTFAGFTA
ncbi:hypothetical protein ES703_16458 [subsurface metagenome]